MAITDRERTVVSLSVRPGTQLNGIYEIDSSIAVGGMGEVFRGHNIQTGDPVAIKIVLPEFAKDEMILQLFRKEARILNHLSHDAIVRYYVFSIDAELGRPYLAMEFVDGPSLGGRVAEGPLPVDEVIYLFRRLADGLQRAHEAGVIHRDISPDNVILPEGRVERAKIIDFGIARSALTGSATILGGSFAGKYNFVSPEQLGLFGGEITPKSDIYSLGLVLAAALRGRPIDMRGSQVEVIEKRRAVPSLDGIDPKLEPLLKAMLQPDPADRPGSMAEVRDWPIGENEVRGVPPLSKAAANRKPGASSPPKRRTTPAARPLRVPEPRKMSLRPRVAAGLIALLAILLGVFGARYYVQNSLWQSSPSASPELPASEPSPPQRTEAEAKAAALIGGFAGGECFFAMPQEVTPNRAIIAAFGDRPPQFQDLFEYFKAKSGLETLVARWIVSDPQCPALSFAQKVLRPDKTPIPIALQGDASAGTALKGNLGPTAAGTVSLLVVDGEGIVHDLSSTLAKTAQGLEFTIPLPGGADPSPRNQLIIALQSEPELPSLKTADGQKSGSFFPALSREANEQGTSLGLAAFRPK
ncbi:MAG: serine/threonine-protein kinase [Hyphomicrobiales bacterium]